jgi:heptosyltransferase-1
VRDGDSILVVRLGAMGDIIHSLPAVASLRASFPNAHIVWAVASKWIPILKGNPNVNQILDFDRGGASSLFQSWMKLRAIRPAFAIDFQGLVQSALVARASRPALVFGWARGVARESVATPFYSQRITPTAVHIVDRNIELARGAGAQCLRSDFWIPEGRPEGDLPARPYVLAHPFAGWKSKQWPLDRYEELARKLAGEEIDLVANVPPARAEEVSGLPHVKVHISSLEGLIYATRRASAVLGLDSGPLHLAAALQKPGVALFGPTDPQRNGPYGGRIQVLRASGSETTYKRRDAIDRSMRALSVDLVFQSLQGALKRVEPRA